MGTLLIYSILGFVAFCTLVVIFTFLNCGQLIFMLSAIITFMVIIIFFPQPVANHVIFLFSGIIIVYFTWYYLRFTHPKNKHQAMIATYYGEQLVKQLRGYQIVYVDLFGYDPFPLEKENAQVYWFITTKIYTSLIRPFTIINAHWEFPEIIGKPDEEDYPNQRFIVLILDRLNASSIAIPLSGRVRQKNTSTLGISAP